MAGATADSRGWSAVTVILSDRKLVRWLLVLVAAVAALFLGYTGLSGYLAHQPSPSPPQFGRSWADILFYDLQLFVINAAPTQGAGPFPVALGIARFLAPATTVLATVETVRLLLSEQLRRWSTASAANHAVVTGDGPVAVELARKLRAEYRKVVLVSADPLTAEQARRHHQLDVFSDPADPGTLRAAGVGRADVLYACGELSASNAATALRAREIAQSQGRMLTTYAQVRDAEICCPCGHAVSDPAGRRGRQAPGPPKRQTDTADQPAVLGIPGERGGRGDRRGGSSRRHEADPDTCCPPPVN